MPVIYDDGQLAIAEEARRALAGQARTATMLDLLEQTGGYDEAYWRLVREQGWTAATLAELHGGLDLSLVELELIALQTGRVLAGAPFLTSSFGVGRAIAALAPDHFKAEWLPLLAAVRRSARWRLPSVRMCLACPPAIQATARSEP